jgi:hypothetical protein
MFLKSWASVLDVGFLTYKFKILFNSHVHGASELCVGFSILHHPYILIFGPHARGGGFTTFLA